jgi:hypothetical protein
MGTLNILFPALLLWSVSPQPQIRLKQTQMLQFNGTKGFTLIAEIPLAMHFVPRYFHNDLNVL